MSEAAASGGLSRKLKAQKRLVAVENTRGKLRNTSMVHNGATPKIGDLCGGGGRGAARLRAGGHAADGAEVFFVLSSCIVAPSLDQRNHQCLR